MKTSKEIIKKLNEGVQFGNFNTGFRNMQGEMLMCEFTKDCKYTSFISIEKFARRILRFTKTGY